MSLNGALRSHYTDFQGRVPEHSEHAAQTYYSVRSNPTFLDKDHLLHEVTCVFVKSKSWVRANSKGNTALLDHERLHFDIAECNARALRSALLSITSSKEAPLLVPMISDSVNASWKLVHSQYDLETAHGTIAKEQARWAWRHTANRASWSS